MPVHAIRIETSKVSEGTPLPTVIGNTLSELSTVLPEEEFDLRLFDPTPYDDTDGPYRAGLWRFDPGEHGADELVKTFEDALRGNAKWARIRYHLCNRDLPIEERPESCTWDESRTVKIGPVPNNLH